MTKPERPIDVHLATARDRLVAAGCVAADEEAAVMLAAGPDAVTLASWLRRREDGEPLAWIVGSMTFCGRPLAVTDGVYVPRRQSEALAQRAARALPSNGRALDLCTGAGAVAAHLRAAVPGAFVLGVDIDALAAACARRNGVVALVGDLGAALRPGPAFDVVTAVAPYVPTAELRWLPRDVQRHEPALALDGGEDGLDLVRRVVADAARLLRPGGSLLLEVGGDQDTALAPTLRDAGFSAAEPWYDGDGDLRGIRCMFLQFGR